MDMSKTYSELVAYSSFEDRLNYLLCHSQPGYITFGVDRIFNQIFYRSEDWKYTRRQIILRDQACDLGVHDQEIIGEPIIIHHINPITIEDIYNCSDLLFNPENLISTRDHTHKLIHYGCNSAKPLVTQDRKPGDTSPWKK